MNGKTFYIGREKYRTGYGAYRGRVGGGGVHVLTFLFPFVVVLNVVIFVLCFGRFALARICNVKVQSILIGRLGRLRTWRDRDNSEWVLGWVPVGGGVKFAVAEAGGSAGDHGQVALSAASVAKQTTVLFAGPVFVLIFAASIFAINFFFAWEQVSPARIDEVVPGTAADQAGLKAGDHVVSIDGTSIRTWQELVWAISLRADRATELLVDRKGSRIIIAATPRRVAITRQDGTKLFVGALGIRGNATIDDWKWVRVHQSFVDAAASGFEMVGSIIARTVDYKWHEMTGGHLFDVPPWTDFPELRTTGLVGTLNLTGLLATSFGLVTTASSAGWILFLRVQKVVGTIWTRRATRVAIAALVVLVLLATWKDLARIFP